MPDRTAPRIRGQELPSRQDVLRWGLWTVCVAALLAIIASLPARELFDALQSHEQFAGWRGGFTFIGSYVVFTTVLIPVWPMPFIAGAVFGTVKGTAISSLSCVLAGAFTFLLARTAGRTALRETIERSPRLRAFEKTVNAADWKIVAAVRLSHFMTFGMQNYAFGMTNISLRTFLLTTWLVTLPGTLLQCYLGDLGFSSVGAWQSQSMPGWQVWGMRIGGLCLIAIAVIYLGHRARRMYREVVQTRLEENLRAETARDGSRGQDGARSWLLPCLAASLTVLAIAAVFQRDAMRNYVERHWIADAEGRES